MTKQKMKIKFHVPTQQYGFLEVEGDIADVKQMESVYNKYAETPIAFKEDVFKKYLTFTGEEIYYDEVSHKYTDMDGNALISGSAYKKSLEKPFEVEFISGAVSKKHGVPQQTVKDMWSGSGRMSRNLGNAIHFAMEQWYRYRDVGTEKEYHLPKHPFLREMVQSFPEKDSNVVPEAMVSDVANKRVGQIDGILMTGDKKCVLIDYKSDAKIEGNVAGHFNQLNYYAHILINHGWTVEKLVLWNYTTEWKSFESEVFGLK